MSTSDDDGVARLDDVLASLPTGVLLLHDSVVIYANRAAQRLFGDRAAEGTHVAELGSTGLTEAVVETAESGQSLRLDIPHGDRQFAVRTNVATDGAVVVVLTDVTDIRRVETLRRDFVTNASHELKTPVAGIQALAESLELAIERSPERAHSMVARLQVEAQRLSQLVRELLDLARLEDDADVPRERLQRVDLAEVSQLQAERVAARAERLGVEVHVDAPEPAAMVGSAADLRLIVANLIENAVDYNVPG
ncbi:MAG: histidine kinase dimerization/phospho-acceptor domain-containing protein, partial [Nitriliruptoraceae bacterium]